MLRSFCQLDLARGQHPALSAQTFGLAETCAATRGFVADERADAREARALKEHTSRLRSFLRESRVKVQQKTTAPRHRSRSKGRAHRARSRVRVAAAAGKTYPVIVCTIDYLSEYLLDSETFLTGANKFAADRNYRVLAMSSGRIAKDGNFAQKLTELVAKLATSRPPSGDGSVKGTLLVIDTKNDQSLQASVFSVCYSSQYVNVAVCGGSDDAAKVWFDVNSKMVQLAASELSEKTTRPVLIMPFSKSFISPRQQRDRREGGVGLIRLSPQVSSNVTHMVKYLRLRLGESDQALPRVAVMTSFNTKGRSIRDAFLQLYQDAGQSDSLLTVQYDSNSAPDKEDKTKRFFSLDADAYVVNGDAELLVFTDFIGFKPAGKLLFIEGLMYNNYILFNLLFLNTFFDIEAETSNLLFCEYAGELTANNTSRADFIRTLSSVVVANAATMPTLLGYDALLLADRMVDEYVRLGELASPSAALRVASQLRGITGSFVFDEFYDRSNGDNVIAARILLGGTSLSDAQIRRPRVWAELDVATLQSDSRTYNVSNVLDLDVSLRYAFQRGLDFVQNATTSDVSLLSSSSLRSVYVVRNANGNQVISEQSIGLGSERNVLPTSLSVQYDTQEGFVYKSQLARARVSMFAPSDDIALDDGTPAYQFANLLGAETNYDPRNVIQLTLILPDFRVCTSRIPFEYASVIESFETDLLAADTRHVMMIVSYEHLLSAYSGAYANRQLRSAIAEAVDLLLLQLFARCPLLFRLNLVADGAAAAIVPQLSNIQELTFSQFARVVFVNPPPAWPETQADAENLIAPPGNKQCLDGAAQRLYDEEVSKLDRMSYGTSYLDISAVFAMVLGDAFDIQNSAATNWYRLQDMIVAGAEVDRHSTSRANEDLTLYDALLRLEEAELFADVPPVFNQKLRQDLSWMKVDPALPQDVRDEAIDLLLTSRPAELPIAFNFVKEYTLESGRASATLYGLMQIAYFRNMQSSLPALLAESVPGRLLASTDVLSPVTATALLFPYDSVVTKALVRTPRSLVKSVGMEISVANKELGIDNVVVDAQLASGRDGAVPASRIMPVVAAPDFKITVDAIAQRAIATIQFMALGAVPSYFETASVDLLASLLSSTIRRFRTLRTLQARRRRSTPLSTCSLLRYGGAALRPDLPVAVICMGNSECIYSDVDSQPQGRIAQLLDPFTNVLYVNYGDFQSSASMAQAIHRQLGSVFESADIVLFGFSMGTTVCQALAKILLDNEKARCGCTAGLRLTHCILTNGISNITGLRYLSNIDKRLTAKPRKQERALIDGMYVTILYKLLIFNAEERLPIVALADQVDSIREFIYRQDSASASLGDTLFQRDWTPGVSLLLVTNANDLVVSPDHFSAIAKICSGRGLRVQHVIFRDKSQVDALMSHNVYRDDQYAIAVTQWLRKNVATVLTRCTLKDVNAYIKLDDAKQATNATVLKDFSSLARDESIKLEAQLVDSEGDGKTFNKLLVSVQKFTNAVNAIIASHRALA